ncbi:tetratricopeptide repeat protein [bacterium]|nr:tetratricopeptide repeat protein [bacterium]
MKDQNKSEYLVKPQSFISNRYQVVKKLGSGGMGIVYLAKDILRGNRLNALKTIKKEIIDETSLDHFRQEFEVMIHLKHPNLAQVYNFGFDKQRDSYYIIMEYIQGVSLKELLKQKQRIPEDKVIDIIVALCRTLAFIHSRKILHNDIKPGNIMLKDASIKVLDFGLAELGKPKKNKTKGTLFYMAPEIFHGNTSPRSDIYAAGVTFYELLTGKTLFSKSVPSEIISILKNKREFMEYKRNAFQKIENPAVKLIITGMIEFNPEDRYQCCSEIISDINVKLNKDYVLETSTTREAYVLGAGFVGRQKELSKLKTKLKCPNSHKVLLVKGKAGIGKSRLFQEFRNWCQMKNIPFLEADCSEKFPKTFAPFLHILNEVLLKVSSDQIDEYGPELKKIIPDHDQFRNIETAPSLDPKTERGIFIQNITGLLLDYSKKHEAVVIYLNDLHRADEGSLEVLGELLYKLSLKKNDKNSLRVYAGAREEEMGIIESHLDVLRKKQRIEETYLSPFDRDHVGNFLYAVFGENCIAESLKNVVPEMGARVGGNPFFLQESIRSLVENEYITRDCLKWKLVKPVRALKIPGTLKSILQKRLGKLNLLPEEEKALQYFSLFNKEISMQEFDRLTDEYIEINSEEFFNEMERKELFTSGSVAGDLKYGFKHSLIREVVEEDIQDKQKIHLRIAGRLENIHKSNIDYYVDDLAYHYSRTDDREKAVLYLEKAGDVAKTSYANEKAIGYYDQMLEMLDNNEKEKRIRILYKQCEILDLIGKRDDELKYLSSALKLSEEIDNKMLQGKIQNMWGGILIYKGDYPAALQLFENAMEIFSGSGDKKEIAHTVDMIGRLYFNQGDFFQARNCYEKTLEISEELGDEEGISIAVCNMGNVYLLQGDYSQARSCYERSLKISEEFEDKKGICVVVGNMGHVCLRQGDYPRAMNYFNRLLEISAELGEKKGICVGVGNMGSIYLRQGDYARAMKCFERSLKISEELGDKKEIGANVGNMGNIHLQQGDYSQALKCFERSLRMSEELGDKHGVCVGIGNMGKIYLQHEDYSQAMKCFERSLKISEEIDDKYSTSIIVNNIGKIYLQREDYSQAMKCVKRSLKISEEIEDKKGICISIGNMGSICLCKGEFFLAMKCFEKSLNLSKEIGDKKSVSANIGNIGKIYLQQGNYSRAMKYIERSLNISEEIGDKRGICIAAGNIGNVYKKTSVYVKAEKYYDKVIAISKQIKEKNICCLNLYEKADLYFIIKKLNEAEVLNKEAQIIVVESTDSELCLKIDILGCKIKFAKGDKVKAIGALDNILIQTKDNTEIALLNYELWKLKRLEPESEKAAAKHKTKALELYRKLCKKTPDIEYMERVEELEQKTEETGSKRKDTSIITALESTDKREYVSELIEIITHLNSNLPLSGLLIRIVDLSIRFIDASRGFLLLFDPNGQLQVEVARDWQGNDLNPVIDQDMQISQTVINKVTQEGRPLFVPDISDIEDLALAESVLEMQLQSVMCIPLGRRQRDLENKGAEKRQRFFPARVELLGVLYVDSRESTEKDRFTGRNLSLLQAIADQTSIALVNTLLYERSNVDSLTGLYLRPYFEDSLRLELIYHKTHDLPLCTMMMDIDYFKKINDIYGHQAGDNVLRIIGGIFKRILRSTDICSRYGGDEFAVMLPNAGGNEVERIAEKIINAVSSFNFSCGVVTISIGISEYPRHGKDVQELLKRADEALYSVKAHGRKGYRVWRSSYALVRRNFITDVLSGDPVRDYRNVEMLMKSIGEAASTLELKKLIQRITENLLEITGSERCILMLVNQNGELEIRSASNSKGEELNGDLYYSRSICRKVMEEGLPVYLNDIGVETASESQMSAGLRSAMSVPLFVRSKQIGVIYVDSCQIVRQFTSADLSIFSAIVSQLAFAIENSRLHEETIKAGKVKEQLLEKEIIDLRRKLSGE